MLMASLVDSRLVSMTMACPYRAEPMRYMGWKLFLGVLFSVISQQNFRDTNLNFVPRSNNEGCLSKNLTNTVYLSV